LIEFESDAAVNTAGNAQL